MNQTHACIAGPAMFMKMVPVAGVSEGIVAGMKTAYSCTTNDAANETAFSWAAAENPLTNERLLAYAARNPPPQSWYEQEEDLF